MSSGQFKPTELLEQLSNTRNKHCRRLLPGLEQPSRTGGTTLKLCKQES